MVTVEPLLRAGSAAAWRYTPPIGQAIDSLNVRIDVLRSTAQPQLSGGFDGLAMAEWEDRWVAELSQEHATANQPLTVQVPDPRDAVLVSAGQDSSGEAFFGLQTYPHSNWPKQPAAGNPQPSWTRLGYVSRGEADIERDLTALSALLQVWGDTTVVIQPFADRAYPRQRLSSVAATARRWLITCAVCRAMVVPTFLR